MPPATPMLVLVVRETGLRSALVARLSLAGVDVVTADSLDDQRVRRWLANRPVLIIDQAALADCPGGEAVLQADSRWRDVAVIGGASTDIAAAIEAKLPGWGYPAG